MTFADLKNFVKVIETLTPEEKAYVDAAVEAFEKANPNYAHMSEEKRDAFRRSVEQVVLNFRKASSEAKVPNTELPEIDLGEASKVSVSK